MSKTEPDLLLLLGNHLYPSQHLKPYRDIPILMVEDPALCGRRAYHQQKLGLLIAAMREYAKQLRAGGFDVRYFELEAQQSISQALADLVGESKATCIATFEISDRGMNRLLDRFVATHGVDWQVVGDPGFLTSRADFAAYAAGKKTFVWATFTRSSVRSLGYWWMQKTNP